MSEEWRPIPGHDGYEASSDGRVRSWRCKQGRRSRPLILTARANRQGRLYLRVGKKRCAFLGAVVLSAFYGPRPPGLSCLHFNDDQQDNRPENLRWGTAKENKADARRNGRIAIGETHPLSKLTEEDVRSIMARVAAGEVVSAIAADLGVSRRSVSNVVHGWAWSWLTGVVRA